MSSRLSSAERSVPLACSESSSSSSSASSSSSSVIESRASRSGRKGKNKPDGVEADADELCKRISKKLSVDIHDTLACADHRKACSLMCSLKTLLLDETCEREISPMSKMTLTCTGVHLFKRIASEVEPEEMADDMKSTLCLLFVLIVMCNRPRSANVDEEQLASVEVDGDDAEGMDVESDPAQPCKSSEERELDLWYAGNYSQCMLDDDAGSVAVGDDLKQGWKSHSVCQMCLKIADANASRLTFDEMKHLSNVFFHQSSLAMSSQIFNQMSSKKPNDYLTLSAVSFLNSASIQTGGSGGGGPGGSGVKLASIADIAESESGQQVLRDFILSFTLPRSVVGVRKTCLLTRKANNVATKEFPVILNEAHDAAMRGAEYSWNDDPKTLHKICALLAGIAVILTKNAQSIRRDDAFRGRVSLPFLETCIEKQFESMPRLQYLPDSDDWIIYTLKSSSHSGMPWVEYRGRGFDGCCQACLLFMRSVDM